MIKNKLNTKLFAGLLLFSIGTNVIAQTLPEKNAQDIIIMKKAIVKLIKERDYLSKKCNLTKKQLNLPTSPKHKEVKRNISKNEVKDNILKNKNIEEKNKKSKIKAKSYIALRTKYIYKEPTFKSKKISKIKKNEIFSTTEKIKNNSWIFINDTGYIYVKGLTNSRKK